MWNMHGLQDEDLILSEQSSVSHFVIKISSQFWGFILENVGSSDFLEMVLSEQNCQIGLSIVI